MSELRETLERVDGMLARTLEYLEEKLSDPETRRGEIESIAKTLATISASLARRLKFSEKGEDDAAPAPDPELAEAVRKRFAGDSD